MKNGRIIIQAGRKPWPHELRVANILALAGHDVEFLPESSVKTADILVDGKRFEIKSPESFNPNTLEHTIKDALKQAPNIIIDSSRIRKIKDEKVYNYLMRKAYDYPQIKKLVFVTKKGRIIDISELI